MITWPESFPKPTVNFNIKLDSNSIRTKMDSGRTVTRRRSTRNFRMMGVSWDLTDLEYGYFQSIYLYVINSGDDWFNISLPMGDGLKLYRVKFAEQPGADHKPVLNWKVTAKFETEDEPAPWSATEIDALMAADFDVDAFTGTVDELHEYVHVYLPPHMFV